jgi:hypothetical protein
MSQFCIHISHLQAAKFEMISGCFPTLSSTVTQYVSGQISLGQAIHILQDKTHESHCMSCCQWSDQFRASDTHIARQDS